MNIDLTPYETEVLEATLVDAVSHLQVEIGRTDTHDFKELLRQRQLALESIARKMGSLHRLVQL